MKRSINIVERTSTHAIIISNCMPESDLSVNNMEKHTIKWEVILWSPTLKNKSWGSIIYGLKEPQLGVEAMNATQARTSCTMRDGLLVGRFLNLLVDIVKEWSEVREILLHRIVSSSALVQLYHWRHGPTRFSGPVKGGKWYKSRMGSRAVCSITLHHRQPRSPISKKTSLFPFCLYVLDLPTFFTNFLVISLFMCDFNSIWPKCCSFLCPLCFLFQFTSFCASVWPPRQNFFF